MSIRNVKFASGEYYHIYNRGNSKQNIFNTKDDYFHFMGLLYACNSYNNLKTENLTRKNGLSIYDFERDKTLVSIGSYTLMPNHFHIIIMEKETSGISKFMQKLSTAYSMYFNKKNKRSGSLFEGKFKSRHLNNNRYLKYSFSYLHLNPLKIINKKWKEEGIENINVALAFLNNYKYSSYLDFMGLKRAQNNILNIEDFPKYFPDKASFSKEIFEWIKYQDDSELGLA